MRYCGGVKESGEGTAMVHYVCDTCGMSATMVATPTGDLAWLDHMATHAVKDGYRAYTWTVLRLEGL